jgi:hypothetical protein
MTPGDASSHASIISVAVPGVMPFTRTPWGAQVTAAVSVMGSGRRLQRIRQQRR